jgi:hypothetical protein
VDIFLGQYQDKNPIGDMSYSATCPWLIAYKRACGTNWDGMDVIKTIIIPEMTKNSALHRLVKEIDTELKLLQ